MARIKPGIYLPKSKDPARTIASRKKLMATYEEQAKKSDQERRKAEQAILELRRQRS